MTLRQSRRGEPDAEILTLNAEHSIGRRGRTSMFELVEAAGVEPASENVTGQETTCLFRFMPRAFGALRRFPQDVRGCALRTDKKR